jgi:hypothetical protein
VAIPAHGDADICEPRLVEGVEKLLLHIARASASEVEPVAEVDAKAHLLLHLSRRRGRSSDATHKRENTEYADHHHCTSIKGLESTFGY